MEPDNDDVSGGGCLKRDFTKVSLRYNSDHVNKTLSPPLEDFIEFEEIICLDYKACCLSSQSVAQ